MSTTKTRRYCWTSSYHDDCLDVSAILKGLETDNLSCR